MAGIDMAEFEGAGERYKFLIQPVKDLAANWDLDIAKTLEDYIRKVVEQTNRIDADPRADEDGRHKVFNFAEAALLIHGTTTVYARKVEYVLLQAQNFFDQLREDENIHEQQQKGKRRKDGAVAVEGAEPIEEEADENSEPNQRQEKRQPKLNYAALGHFLERLQQRQSPLLPVVPIAFFPLTDFEKQNVPLCTRTNPIEVFGKKEDFKLNSCHVHESVALLDFKNIAIVNKFSYLTLNSQKKGPSLNRAALEPLMEQSEEDLNEGLDCGAESSIHTTEFRQTDLETGRRGTESSAPGATPGLAPQHQIVFDELCGTETIPEPTPSLNETPTPNIPSLVFLDPTDLVNDQSRPFRRSNCVMKAVKQIKARDRRIERDCREKGVLNVATVKCYIDTRIYLHQLKKREYTLGLFNTFIADQAVLALNPLIHKEEKRRAELRKRRQKEFQNAERAERAMRRAVQQQEEEDSVLDDHLEGAAEDYVAGIVDAQNDNEMNDFDDPMDELVAEEIINLPPGEDWTNELDEGEHQNLGDILEVEDLENSFGGVQNLYAGFEHLNASQRKRAKTLALQRNFYDDTIFVDGENLDDLPPRPISQMDYDEIIAFHLRKYWTASEQATSAFSENIQRWEAKMTEVLEREQLHREFCTSTYGDELLERFGGQIGSEIDLTKILAELPNDYDQSRFLLVSLILANMGNVHILTDEDGVEEQHHIRLRLLSAKRMEFSL